MKNRDKTNLNFRQRISLCRYKLEQVLRYIWQSIKEKSKRILESFAFHLLLFGVFILFFHKAILRFGITLSNDDLRNISIGEASIIGASIAIIFSFSTFILQSTSDLFSTQYLNKFIQNVKEKIFFWLLVCLSLISILTPFFFKKYTLEILVAIFLAAFYLIYDLYKELRKRINPETTLIKIQKDAFNQLERINKEFRKQSDVQNKVFKHEKKEESISLEVQYKVNSNWNRTILQNVKYLFEIGLRLLAKNEINSFNLTVRCIHDIYIKHLNLRNGHFVKMPASFWGTYSIDDEGFTTKILEYMKSMSERVIQEKRKENIYFLLSTYESILNSSLNIEYAKISGGDGCNPLLNLIMAYYAGLIDKLLLSKDTDLIWESIKSLSKISNCILQKTDDHYIYSQLNQVVNKISVYCLTNHHEAYSQEIATIYFNQITIAWNRYEHNDIFWQDLFKEMKRNILALSISANYGLSVGELFINFFTWQTNTINSIFGLEENEVKQKYVNQFMRLLSRWSQFLLDFARDMGLNNQTGLSIIQSLDNNLKIIYGIRHAFSDKDLEDIYRTQFNTMSWYFQKTEKVEGSHLFYLESVLEILLREINHNLKENIFDIQNAIKLFIQLVERHFEKVELGHGYEHPRVIIKLVYLGLLLNKYKKTDLEKCILEKIDEMNKKYLELNKEYFEMKRKEKNLMGPDQHQLCSEIYDLENELFPHHKRSSFNIMKNILMKEITKEQWGNFKEKIGYCRGIEYRTEHIL